MELNVYKELRKAIAKNVKARNFFDLNLDKNPADAFLHNDDFKFLASKMNGFFFFYNYVACYYEYFSEGIRSELGYDPDNIVGERGIQNAFNMLSEEQKKYFITFMTEVLNYLGKHSTYGTAMDYRYTCNP